MALLGLFGGMFGRKRHERAGFALYTAAVRAARDRFYYAELRVPDTLDGRFDMIGIFVVLLIDRLRRESPPGPALAQAVFDAMFSDMDHTLREMGVSDMTVGRKVRAMWEALHGRGEAYAAALASHDRLALEESLARNVWRGVADVPVAAPGALADAVERQYRAVAAQTLDGLLAGEVAFAPVAVPA